jgi:hypothetical protein
MKTYTLHELNVLWADAFGTDKQEKEWNKQYVKVDDEKEWLSKLFKLVNNKVNGKDLSLLFYIEQHYNELSQSDKSEVREQ